MDTPSSFASVPASPQWSIWPWVMRIFSISTPCWDAAAFSRPRSPPGSTNAPLLVDVHHSNVQFCCNGVTGMIEALRGGGSFILSFEFGEQRRRRGLFPRLFAGAFGFVAGELADTPPDADAPGRRGPCPHHDSIIAETPPPRPFPSPVCWRRRLRRVRACRRSPRCGSAGHGRALHARRFHIRADGAPAPAPILAAPPWDASAPPPVPRSYHPNVRG